VVRAIERIQNLSVVAGVSYLHYQQRDLRELADFLQAGLVKGLKLYPGYEPFYPNDPKFDVVYDFAAKHRLPVMIHSGDTYSPSGKVKYSHPLHVDEVAVDHPGVNFVICHIGNPWIRDCMEVVYKNKNVYTDISGLVLGNFTDRFEEYMRRQLQEMLVYGVEPDKVLFGTDWPISSMESYIEFIDDIALPPKEKKKILFENSVEVFRLREAADRLEAGGLKNFLS
jgi:predicted TIM-barrel fold metal-dependent hydrolase